MARKKNTTNACLGELDLIRKIQGELRVTPVTQTEKGTARLIQEDTYRSWLSKLDSLCDRLKERR